MFALRLAHLSTLSFGRDKNQVTLQQLTATTPALTREGEDEHMLSSEACAISQPLSFPHCRLTMQPPKSYSVRGQRSSRALQASPQALSQTTGVAGAQ
ncbi:UNVERIFIED_CONTAM: hypothetical protein FKN15_056088 [Acipenser sinensis]